MREEFLRREEAEPGGGQLDGQGQSVEPSAYGGDSTGVLHRDLEPGEGARRHWYRKRCDLIDDLSSYMPGTVAGREDTQLGRGGEQLCQQRGCGSSHMFAVVDHEPLRPLGERLPEPGVQSPLRTGDTQGIREDTLHVSAGRDGCEVDQHRGGQDVHRPCEVEGQACLANTCGPGERHQPVVGDKPE
jgi:hypothetical protein